MGPVHKAFAALEADLIALLRQANRGGAAGLGVLGEYLEDRDHQMSNGARARNLK